MQKLAGRQSQSQQALRNFWNKFPEIWNRSAKPETKLINMLHGNKTLIFGVIFSSGQGKNIYVLSKFNTT